MQVKISQAIPMITGFIKAKLVPMVVGSPGCGKSQIVHSIAKEYGLKVIDLRLSQCDPTDLMGFPNIQGSKAGYVPMNTFPIEGDAIPEGYNGWLLFLDEFNSATPAVQAASYKVVLDRMVGQYHLHKNVAIVCAGNLETDNAIVQSMNTALQSRLVHMELLVDSKEWTDWAASNGIDHRITSFIKFKPSNLFTFQPDHTDKTYACPRTWEFADRLVKSIDSQSPEFLLMLAGTISEGVAREFVSYCKIFNDLPKIEQIIAAPETTVVPAEPSILFAMTGHLAEQANKNNCATVIKYLQRFPVEFQIICIREMIRRDKKLLGHEAIENWHKTNAEVLF